MNRILRELPALMLLFPVLLVSIPAGGHGQVLDRSVARVRLTETASIGQRALRSQVELYEQQSGQEISSEQRREILEIMINEELIEQAAERDGVSISDDELDRYIGQERRSLGRQMSDEQFRLLVEQELGLEYEDYREELRKQLLQQQYIQQSQRDRFENLEEPSEEEIRSVYNENVSEFINPSMVRFSHIYVDARSLDDSEREDATEDIEELWDRMNDDELSFEQALEEAEDNSALGASDFGYLPQNDRQLRGQLGADFVDNLFDLEEGDVEGVLESQIGLHVVQVTDTRDRRFLNLDDPLAPGQSVTVRDNIRNYILNNRMQQEFSEATEEVLSELRDEAEIDVNESNLDW
ncbi:MAG: peptidyl-prolyl cis-trans isomerase [Spirochaetota bacterium]